MKQTPADALHKNTAASYADEKFIHIVGMYKCGTSWLSRILAAHPEVIAWREFDIIRATHAEKLQPTHHRISARLANMLHRPPPRRSDTEFELKTEQEIMRDVFFGRGWIPLMAKQARDEAEKLNSIDSGYLVDELMALKGQQLRNDESPSLRAYAHTQTLGVSNTRRADLTDFLDAVRQPGELANTPLNFFRYLQGQGSPGTPMVLKAADQIMALKYLQHYSPVSRKLAVIRDGRDAAISATHYRQLMGKRDAPWALKPRAYLTQLSDWAIRARELAQWADQAEVTIVRYEDLQRDFCSAAAALFTALDLPCSDQALSDIQQSTHFTAASGGRAPGQPAQHVVRKGTIGEWQTTLSPKQASRAWKLAGAELERFGYTESGSYADQVPGVLSPIQARYN